MKKMGYALGVLALIGCASIVNADEWVEIGQDGWKGESSSSATKNKKSDAGSLIPSFGSAEVKPAPAKELQAQKTQTPPPSRYVKKQSRPSSRDKSTPSSKIRVGLVHSADLKFTLDDGYVKHKGTYPNPENGFELSYVTGIESYISGVESPSGFDFRPVLTFQYVSSKDYASTASLLGEFEFAYNLHKYANPFIGFNGGFGYVSIDDSNIDSTLNYQFGLFIGVSGEVYEDFGYYLKLEGSTKGMFITEDDGSDSRDWVVRTTSWPLRFGASYAF